MAKQEKVTLDDVEREAWEEYREGRNRTLAAYPQVDFEHPLDPRFRARMAEFARVGDRIHPEIRPEDLDHDETPVKRILAKAGVKNGVSLDRTVKFTVDSYGVDITEETALVLVNQDSTIRELARNLDEFVLEHPVLKTDPTLHSTVHLNQMRVRGRSGVLMDAAIFHPVNIIRVSVSLHFTLVTYNPVPAYSCPNTTREPQPA